MLTELLMSDQPAPAEDPKETTVGGNELLTLAERYDAWGDRFAKQNSRPVDDSSPVIAVNHQACILCDRCIRGCDEIPEQRSDRAHRKGIYRADRLRPRRSDG